MAPGLNYDTVSSSPRDESSNTGGQRLQDAGSQGRGAAPRLDAMALLRRDAISDFSQYGAPSDGELAVAPLAFRGMARQRRATEAVRIGRNLFVGLTLAACMLCMAWPALWNGYPIAFADTGTYLSQAMHHYLGWDRPVFYSLAIDGLHLGLTTWPVIVAQAAVAVLVLDQTRRAMGVPRGWLPPLIVFLALTTWLPWLASELMPDLFTPLLVLLLSVLVFAPSPPAEETARPSLWARWRRPALVLLAAFMIATQQSSVPLSISLLSLMLPLRLIIDFRLRAAARLTRNPVAGSPAAGSPAAGSPVTGSPAAGSPAAGSPVTGSPAAGSPAAGSPVTGSRGAGKPFAARPAATRPTAGRLATPLLAPALAVAAMMLVNTIGFSRVSISPYGNVFVLARVIYDGPGMDVLRQQCPSHGWVLCPFLDRFPDTANRFLWDKNSPVMLAGGHRAVSADADAIIQAAIRAEPGKLLAATVDNTLVQLTRFASGDGLNAWPEQVDPWIDNDFSATERAAFHAARQQRGALEVPPWLAATHRATALAGIAAALALLPLTWRRRPIAAAFLLTALLSLPVSALVTGGLSAPHDRYQSRIVWLPACVAFLSIPALLSIPAPRRRS
jgi:hypothetical protein